MHARATAARSDSPKTVTAAVTTAAERIARECSNEQTWPKGSPLDAQTRSGPNTGPTGSAQAGTRHGCATRADYLKSPVSAQSSKHAQISQIESTIVLATVVTKNENINLYRKKDQGGREGLRAGLSRLSKNSHRYYV